MGLEEPSDTIFWELPDRGNFRAQYHQREEGRGGLVAGDKFDYFR